MVWNYFKHNYLDIDVQFCISKIIEYDIEKAGPSILYDLNVLSESNYEKIINHYDRKVYFGKLLKMKPELNEVLNKGFIKYINLFMQSNDIEQSNVLSIKKDSIFLINKKANKLNFNKVNYRIKNVFTSYYHINGYEFYYNSLKNHLDIKGISDINIEKCKIFIEYLKTIFKTAELNKETAIKRILNIRNDYLDKELDIEFYRPLSNDNDFILTDTGFKSEYYENVDDIDISYNLLNYLNKLIAYYIQ